MNKLKINFHGISHGWLYMDLYNNRKELINIRASGVYNPFWDYVNILYNLKHTRKNQVLGIDQGGYNAVLTFKQSGKFIILKTKTDCYSCKRLPDSKNTFLKSRLLDEMKNKLLDYYIKNREEMNYDLYSFTFDVKKLLNIRK